jgi:hypothetical protein
MARPLRRVLIGLSVRLHIGVDTLERYDMATIRQYLGMLSEINKPPPSSPPRPAAPTRQQTPEEMMAAVHAALGHLKG